MARTGGQMIRVKCYFKELEDGMETVGYGEGGSVVVALRVLPRSDA